MWNCIFYKLSLELIQRKTFIIESRKGSDSDIKVLSLIRSFHFLQEENQTIKEASYEYSNYGIEGSSYKVKQKYNEVMG